ncbi:tryptophan-tRNA ligase, chloroplastic/mitochondrial [Capsicum galapagoense]
MGRSLVSHFSMLTYSAPRFASSMYSSLLRSLLISVYTFIRYLQFCFCVRRTCRLRRPQLLRQQAGRDVRCLCSNVVVAVSEPVNSDSSSSPVRKRIVSGVQPTGSIHLGNYLGAIKNWIRLQDTFETFFFIVDLHAITLQYDAQQLLRSTRDTAAIYLACGVDPSKASVFVQSHVRAHVELMWLLSSATPIGWLNRMIQFKEKSRKAGDENVGVALLTYPVLMAADILLYQSDLVPVGEDQKQHLELTRELAERVNYLYGGRKWKKLGGRGGAIFKVPEPLIPPAGARIMSLTDGLSKMSKSAPSDQSRINLLDSKDVIANKIKRCKTDAFPGLEFDNTERPECNNLLSIYQLVTGKTKQEVAEECGDMNWGTFKIVLTDALVDHLHPIQVRYEQIVSDSSYLDEVLAEGARKAADIADVTVNNVYQAMGFLRR